MNINILLYDNFETLDAFGPVEILDKVKDYELKYYSLHGGLIHSFQKSRIQIEYITSAEKEGILIYTGRTRITYTRQ